MNTKSFIDFLESKYPQSDACIWDNVGFQIGDFDKDINKVMICLTLDEESMNYAIDNNIDFIITHHPFIFSPLKLINSDSIKYNIIRKCFEKNIGVYCLHTNLDKISMNKWAAEMICLEKDESFGVENIARVGFVKEPFKLNDDYFLKIKKTFKQDYLIYGGNLDKEIRKVVISLGSCKGIIDEVAKSDVDLFIGGDVGYHDYQLALENDFALIDIGHQAEEIMINNLKLWIKNELDIQVMEYFGKKYSYCYK